MDKEDKNNNKLLKNILDKSKIVHKNEILNQTTIKDAHIYCKINNLSGQVTGPLIEFYIKTKYNMIKNDASHCIGDLKLNEIDIEIKVSNGGKDNNKFNYVQIRMNHLCEYLLTAYYLDYSNIDDNGELFIFRLKKDDIKQLIAKYGGYAHGTISKLGVITKDDLDNPENEKEYALRPKYNDDCWKELLQYKVTDII
jgi:hypothetical protein